MRTPEHTPSIAYLICAVFVFVAHTLDGIDGKQARRTASSSALGEIFDHGCDAWVAVFLPCSTMSIFGEELNPFTMFHIQVLGCFGFVFSHWEKYVTDVLYLPWVFDLSQIIFSLTFVIASNPVINAIITHQRNPRLFLLTFGTVLANVTLRVMAAQLGRMEIQLFSPLTLLYLGTILVHIIGSQFKNLNQRLPMWDFGLLAFVCFMIIVLHLKYAIQLIKEFCTILNIRPFTVTNRAKSS
ncbi:Phosphotransferase [Cichlidogyrus casuarinus]|uniref:Phosphotransferase n=1 Tax=Cichlidogyrus casuarinus TaxID=1844966 RepID=A0ABD2QH24_9PLAT